MQPLFYRVVTLSAALLAGAALLHADSSLTWSERSSGATKDLRGVCYGNSRYLAVGLNGTALQSVDGVTWSALPSFTAAGLRGVVFGGNTFVAVAGFGNNEIWRSVNGTDWAQSASPVSAVLTQVRFINNRFVVVGNAGTIIASTNGTGWEVWLNNGASDVLLYDVAYGNDTYVAVGKDLQGVSFITRSTDGGKTWQTADFTVATSLNGIAYGNGLFVAVGGHTAGQGLLMTSPDGLNWTVQTSTYEYVLEKASYQAGLFAALGSAIVLSPDGLQWTQQTTPQKPFYDICSAQGKLVAVGHRGAILQSDPVKLGPAIFANDAAGTVAVEQAEPVAVTVVLRAGQYENIEADWWVIAIPAEGASWYYYNSAGQWIDCPAGNPAACRPAHQGPLVTIAAPVTVLPSGALACGSYLFYFLVDQRDGILNYPDAIVDAVNVVVR